MSFTNRVLVGLALGVLCGIFFGERMAPLQVASTGFVKLLQMTVLPYVVFSIITSLGSLNYAEARRLGLRVGLVIAGLWCVTFLFVMAVPLTFPEAQSGSFFSTALLEQPHPFNFVDLYIPSNPFHSLANNIVPAIVLFSVLVGVALIGVENKKALLDVLHIAIQAISRATRFIVKLTPYGIFAIAAHAAGTLSLEQIGRIEIFLVAYVGVVLLLALWVLPGLVSALTPIPMREIFQPNRDALVTAFVAGDIFIVLPALMESCEQTLLRYRIGSHDEHKLPEAIVPASFNFPHTGKLLSLSFVLFAGWFADTSLSWRDYPQLALAGLLSIFGSLNAAIPFLLDLFRIPADTFQLFLATGVINARFGSLLAAVHLIVVALLGTAAIAGAVRFQPARLLRFGLLTLAISGVTFIGMKTVFERHLRPEFDGTSVIRKLEPLFPSAPAQVLNAAAPVPAPLASGVYETIRARGMLRVCVIDHRIPLVFRNDRDELVGFEIEAARLLARELEVKAGFLVVGMGQLNEALESERCDIAMSGLALTPGRESSMLFSRSYMDETLGFIVEDHRREQFRDWASIRAAGRLRIAVPDVKHYVQLIRDRLPAAEAVPVDFDNIKLDLNSGFDAYVVPAETGSAMTMLQPEFSVLVPGPEPVRIPIGYPVARQDERWVHIVNDWIELRQKDGTFDHLYRHWILGQSAAPRARRWSILDNWLAAGR